MLTLERLMLMRRFGPRLNPLGLAIGLLATWLLPAIADAQTYPARPVTVVVPYPPGGSVDGVARILAQRLGDALGRNFVVENRAGGVSGAIGANYVAKSAPDGYTLMLSAS